MVLANFVELKSGVPTRMHFTDSYEITSLVWDKDFKARKPKKRLTFWVDRLGGEPAAKTFSIVSEKLASQLRPYLENEDFKNWEFTITKEGEGFATEYMVEVTPFSPI